jgi:hypothetical protein
VLSGEATNTNFIVFGLTRSGLELTIYRTRDEHTNYYTIDVVEVDLVFVIVLYIYYMILCDFIPVVCFAKKK